MHDPASLLGAYKSRQTFRRRIFRGLDCQRSVGKSRIKTGRPDGNGRLDLSWGGGNVFPFANTTKRSVDLKRVPSFMMGREQWLMTG